MTLSTLSPLPYDVVSQEEGMGFLLPNTSRNDSRKTKTVTGRQNGWKEREENRKRVEEVEEEGQSEERQRQR